MSFNNHFGTVAQHYADHRPGYPEALFTWLASLCAQHGRVWDCGAGSGQASVPLAQHFEEVIATDASAEQVAQAPEAPRVQFRVATAEHSGLADASVDLITVAQALHWFDLPRFYAEVRRVLRPGGALAVWTYGVVHVAGDDVDAVLQQHYRDVAGPYWPPERRHVESGYRELAFPFPRIAAPPFALSAQWDLPAMVGYVRTWSATARFIQQRGVDPTVALADALAAVWGDPATQRDITWPLVLLVGRP